uniref:(northern house mosquito) hypothetical protein n=1 Tax=Culex pipiens TaxID=7175 RepID=A0A8D8BTG9_CULPI
MFWTGSGWTDATTLRSLPCIRTTEGTPLGGGCSRSSLGRERSSVTRWRRRTVRATSRHGLPNVLGWSALRSWPTRTTGMIPVCSCFVRRSRIWRCKRSRRCSNLTGYQNYLVTNKLAHSD